MLDDATADEATIRRASFVLPQTAARPAKRPQACWPRGLEIRRATPTFGLRGCPWAGTSVRCANRAPLRCMGGGGGGLTGFNDWT